MDTPSALDDVTVLDLSERFSGAFAARLFADFGAQVWLAEPPGGHPLRHEAPFTASGDALAHGWANRGKASIICAVPETVTALAASSDLIVSTTRPEEDSLLAAAVAAAPGAVHLSLTAHGLCGPHAAWPGNGLTASARVGWAFANGHRDGPPLALPYRISDQISALAAFVSGVAALLRARRDGQGETVDLSETEALGHTFAPWAYLGLFVGGERFAYGPNGARDENTVGPLWQAADGQINFGYGDWRDWSGAMKCLGLEGFAEDPRYAPLLGRNQQDPQPIRQALARAAATREKWTMFHALAEHRCISGVVQDTQSLLASPQLEARRFFTRMRLSGREVRAPGAPAKLSATPWRGSRAAPQLDADRARILRAAASTARPRETPKGAFSEAMAHAHGRPPARAACPAPPLDGVRVLSFTQAWAGPLATELLTFLGAEVVQIEAPQRPDVWRGNGAPVPAAVRREDRHQHPLNTNGMYNSVNLGKECLALDVTTAEGRALLWQLIPKFDVLCDNFSPHVMSDWGLTLERLHALRPDLIFASVSGYGREGPLAEYPANGATTEPMAGLSSIHGYAGGEPMNTAGLIPDPISGYTLAAAILAALAHRARTGEGQRIDAAMLEAVAVTVGQSFLEVDALGRVAVPAGNRHPGHAPHGIYPCAHGEWLALAAESDAAFDALRSYASGALDDQRFSSAPGRLAHIEALEDVLARFTISRSAAELEAELCERGVAAARVVAPLDAWSKPNAQWCARRYLREVAHEESGTHALPMAPWIFSRGESVTPSAAPCFGAQSRTVLTRELGLDEARLDALEAAGVIATAPPW